MTVFVLRPENARERMAAAWRFACQFLELGRAAKVTVEEAKPTRTLEQNDLLQAACGDLSQCLTWFGHRLSKDEWRHLICAAILRVKIVPGINTGDGAPGIVTLGGSSKRLNKAQATEAIQLAFAIGDAPWEYDPTQTQPVRWSDVVLLARGINPREEAA